MSEKEMPSLPARISHFTIAVLKHALNGNPTCTQEEVDRRFEICQKCHFLRQKKGKYYCGNLGCGCNVGRERKKYLNKLGWSDQECPDGRWKREDKKKEPSEDGSK